MSPSTRHKPMDEANDNWLREFVHDLRKTDKKTLVAEKALTSGRFSDRRLCHVYWHGQFLVSQVGNTGLPEDHLTKGELWIETIAALHKLKNGELDDISYADEWLTLAYYRLFRCYNECHERFTLQGLDRTSESALDRCDVLEQFTNKLESEVSRYNDWVHERTEGVGPSNQYHKLRFEDATWQGREGFLGLYNKWPEEYFDLMRNEHSLYLNRSDEALFDVSSLEGNTLIRFFTDDMNFWATALLDRLENLAPFSSKSDEMKERATKEEPYLSLWEQNRKGKAETEDKFSEYKSLVEKFSMLMELLYDLKDRPELNKDDRPTRLREYAELTYLHCIIAALPAQWKKWDDRLRKDKSPYSPWSIIRTNDNAREFLESSSEDRYEALTFQSKDLGYALAAVVRWLAHRTNGFYVALASNTQEGVLISNKTRRAPASSSWGEKVVLRNGETYHQFIASCCAPKHLKRGLNGANRSFNQVGANIGSITLNDVCFGVLQIEFDKLPGELLSKEWTKLWDHGEKTGLLKIFATIIDFFLTEGGGDDGREIIPPNMKKIEDSISLPRLKTHEAYRDFEEFFGLGSDLKFPRYDRTWLHGDEWGENFTMRFPPLKIEMYAIDLEDAVEVIFDENTKKHTFSSNGGYHAQRLYRIGFEEGSHDVPGGAINALSAVGRLLAALLQKNKQSKNQKNTKRNIEILQEIMNRHHPSAGEDHGGVINDLDDKAYHVIWLSFFDWLLHWTEKDEGDSKKFEIESFDAHVKAFLNMSEG